MGWEELRRNLRDIKDYVPQTQDDKMKIEEKMLDQIAALLRVVQDEKEIQIKAVPTDIREYIENGNASESNEIVRVRLNKMVENVNNYHVSEMMIHIMWNTHNNWVNNNINKYDLKKSDESRLFVPFDLLSWNDIEKQYLSILSPIFDSLGIEYDIDAVKKQFLRNQTVFLIDNGIFSKEDLQKRMKNIMADSCEIIYDLEQKNREMLFSNDVMDNISKNVSNNIELNGIKRFKEILAADKDEIGILAVREMQKRKKIYKFADNIGQRKLGLKKYASPTHNKPISKILYDIAITNNIIFVQNIKRHDYKYIDCTSDINRPIRFIKYENCTDEQKKMIAKRNKKVNKFVDKVKNSNNKKFVEPGLITMVTTNRTRHLEDTESRTVYGIKIDKVTYKDIIQIPMTLKELAELKILPQEIGWETRSKALIHSKKSRLLGDGLTKDNHYHAKLDFLNSVKVKTEGSTFKKSNDGKEHIEKDDRER